MLFGILAGNNAKVLEIKEKLQELVKKHKQLYKFTTGGDVKSNSRRPKEGRTKAKTRKEKRMAANIDNILASISSSYKSSDVVDDLDLSKVQLLKLRHLRLVKWIKSLLESGKLAGNIRSMFLQNLKPAVKKAPDQVSESEEEEDSTQEDEASSNEDDDSSDQDKRDEQSIV